MVRRLVARALLVSAVWVMAPVPARADGAEPRLITPPPPRAPAAGAQGYSHKGQLEVSARFAVGLRGIIPYDKIYCGDTDSMAASGFAPVCTGRAPFSIDFELGYGVARQIDLLLEIRVGIEADFGTSPGAGTGGPRMLHFSPGARFFFSDAGKSKLFTTAQLVIDAAGYKDAIGAKLGTDIGVRNLSGLWFDLDRRYGLYVFVGETATVSRWLRFELEAGVGIQGRYR